jgi:hypothetical protein
MSISNGSLWTIQASAAGAESIDEIQVIEEVDTPIVVKVRGGVLRRIGIHEIEIVKEIDFAIVVHIGGGSAVPKWDADDTNPGRADCLK